MKKEFVCVFKITNMIMFGVSYITVGNNTSPDFSTKAMKFVRSKKDYAKAGQCQEEVLPDGLAKEFYRKWDSKHLSDLSTDDYNEVMSDINKLKAKYNHIYRENDTFINKCSIISFDDIKKLSMNK